MRSRLTIGKEHGKVTDQKHSSWKTLGSMLLVCGALGSCGPGVYRQLPEPVLSDMGVCDDDHRRDHAATLECRFSALESFAVNTRDQTARARIVDFLEDSLHGRDIFSESGTALPLNALRAIAADRFTGYDLEERITRIFERALNGEYHCHPTSMDEQHVSRLSQQAAEHLISMASESDLHVGMYATSALQRRLVWELNASDEELRMGLRFSEPIMHVLRSLDWRYYFHFVVQPTNNRGSPESQERLFTLLEHELGTDCNEWDSATRFFPVDNGHSLGSEPETFCDYALFQLYYIALRSNIDGLRERAVEVAGVYLHSENEYARRNSLGLLGRVASDEHTSPQLRLRILDLTEPLVGDESEMVVRSSLGVLVGIFAKEPGLWGRIIDIWERNLQTINTTYYLTLDSLRSAAFEVSRMHVDSAINNDALSRIVNLLEAAYDGVNSNIRHNIIWSLRQFEENEAVDPQLREGIRNWLVLY